MTVWAPVWLYAENDRNCYMGWLLIQLFYDYVYFNGILLVHYMSCGCLKLGFELCLSIVKFRTSYCLLQLKTNMNLLLFHEFINRILLNAFIIILLSSILNELIIDDSSAFALAVTIWCKVSFGLWWFVSWEYFYLVIDRDYSDWRMLWFHLALFSSIFKMCRYILMKWVNLDWIDLYLFKAGCVRRSFPTIF